MDGTEKDRARTEERLKAAAIRVWSEHGFHGAPVQRIAAAAGANVSLINRYFGGKEGLLLAVVGDLIARKQSGALGYAEQLTLEAEVLEYLRFRYREDRADEPAVRLIISELAVNAAFRAQALRSLTYAQDANFSARLARLQAAGAIRPGASVEELFRTIGLFSFSAAFVEGALLGLPPQDTDRLFVAFAGMIATGFGSA